MIIPSITKLGALIIFFFLVFKDFLINTEEAVLKGVINSLTGVINSSFNPLKDILITCGGDSQCLTKTLKTQKKNIINAPNLVMEGMIIHHLTLKKLL